MENNEIVKKSGINLNISLDKDNVPVRIQWTAEEGPVDGVQEAKSMILSLWDGLQKNSMRIDLWTKEMSVEEMNVHMFETFITLADTYERATNNGELAQEIREFAHHFGHRSEVFGPDHEH